MEENIQSYFSLPLDNECDSTIKNTISEKYNLNRNFGANSVAKRPPQPLPRRFLNFPPVQVISCERENSEILPSDVARGQKMNINFSKSWSSSTCLSPAVWIKARGPAAQSWQNRSRSARIRSATISTPIDHMANLSLYSRSRSTEQSRVSTSTLTSQPSTPTPSSPNSTSKTKFSFSPISIMSRAQSTSSINNYVTCKSISDHSITVPFSSKLRPLSLAPNSSITFPARPCSLLSTMSQSTATLRGSSSSLSPTTVCPDSQTSFTLMSNKHNLSSTKQNLITNKSSKISTEESNITIRSISVTAPTESSQSELNKISNDNRKVGSEVMKMADMIAKTNTTTRKSIALSTTICKLNLDTHLSLPTGKSTDDTKNNESINSHVDDSMTHDHGKHCPSCCRYDNCFYI